MIDENIYSKLTPSAKDALNQLTEEYRELLLERAFKIAEERQTSDREISLSDVFEAQKPISNLIEPNKLQNRRKQIFVWLSASGAAYAIAGILLYLYQNEKLFAENNIGLLIALVGLVFTFSVFFYSQLYQKRYSHSNYYGTGLKGFLIVQKWQLIEQLAKKSMSSDNSNEKAYSVSYLIRFLSHKIAKDEADFLKIRELLKVRNKIVHNGYHPNEKEMGELLTFSEELIGRLENSLEQEAPNGKTLKIIKATYGTTQNSIDATESLIQLINNNSLEFVANNELVGDPEWGQPKNLEITYKIGNSLRTETFHEGAKVAINVQESATP